LELVKSDVRLYPVGRLDKDSTGLILLTNDGELAQKLTHPKFHVPKIYEAKVLGNVSKTQIEMMGKGIKLEEGITKPAKVQIKAQSLPHHSILEITLYEGKKRQIRRMMSTLHLHVLELKRISVGQVKLGNLQVGKYRNLTQEELAGLKV
jgi:pseudouridine synthase